MEARRERDAMRDWSMYNPKGIGLDWEARWRRWVQHYLENRRPINGHTPAASMPLLPSTGQLLPEGLPRAERERILKEMSDARQS